MLVLLKRKRLNSNIITLRGTVLLTFVIPLISTTCMYKRADKSIIIIMKIRLDIAENI